MGRRYYCDYCDKTFIDVLEARKKHLQSAHHIKMRNLYYEENRDPATILREELLKTPCRKFAQYGTCQFEGNCKYTHYSPEQLCELRQQVEYMELMKRKKEEALPDIPSLDSWVEKYDKISEKDDVVHTPWSYPDALEFRQDLPPSLVKFKAEHFHDENFEEWGM
ncbi:zinc finger matrin-type protein 5 [Cylas formicarius]|uniref:zinc finger matrin-type protein 5 n=1 Tax=Cylas formicarius TaxID=197179 RepID=UPI002958A770|nr:zinc finger matrin-type protein 5 [Cylas formicarius]